MIEANDMVPLLVGASPGFTEEWARFLDEWADEPTVPYYLVLGGFARHMCGLMAAGDEPTLLRIFAVIERLHIEGSVYVKKAAAVGLLESLQNTNIHLSSTSPKQFERFLPPESARGWHKVRAFWEEGKIITND